MTKSVFWGYSTREDTSIWETNLKTIIKINSSLLKPKFTIMKSLKNEASLQIIRV